MNHTASLVTLTSGTIINLDNVTRIVPIRLRNFTANLSALESWCKKLDFSKLIHRNVEWVPCNSMTEAEQMVAEIPALRGISDGGMPGYYEVAPGFNYTNPITIAGDGTIFRLKPVSERLSDSELDTVCYYEIHFAAPAYGINGGSDFIVATPDDVKLLLG